jgi:hypothetical protein
LPEIIPRRCGSRTKKEACGNDDRTQEFNELLGLNGGITDSLLTLPVSAGKGKNRFPFDEGKRRMGKDKWLFLKEKRKKQWQLYIAI